VIRRWLLFAAALVALVATTGVARAEAPTRVVVRDIQADDTPSARNALVRLLAARPGLTVVSFAHFQKITDRLGVGPKDGEALRAVCRAQGVAALVDGELEADEQDGSTLVLRVRGPDGEGLETQRLTGKTQRALVKELSASGWKRIGPAIEEAGASARKQPAERRVALVGPSGDKAESLRPALEKALGESADFSLVPPSEAESARPAEAAKPAERKLVAAALGASALLFAELSGRGPNRLTVTVVAGKTGEPVGEVKLDGFGVAGLRRAIAKGLTKKLGPLLSGTEPPSPPEEEPDDEDVEADEPAPKKRAKRPSALWALVALRATTRNFRYSDDLFAQLRAYQMGLTPASFVAARWYPAAHFEGGLPAHLGLAASFEQAFLIESRADGESYDTTAREWQLGVRGRLPLGDLEGGVELGLGEHSFAVDDDPNRPLVPDVAYRFVRLGLDARARYGSLSAGGSFGYRHVSEAGSIGTRAWFPRLEVAGLDAGAFAGYALLPGLDALVGVHYRRYWYSMNAEPGDRFVAGGALDSFISAWLGVGWELGAD
jgi:hypothetical protein